MIDLTYNQLHESYNTPTMVIFHDAIERASLVPEEMVNLTYTLLRNMTI